MKFFKLTTISLIAVIIISGCKKPNPGYLSKVLVYSPKTLVATKGKVTTSAAILVDGSTSPINVELTGVRNLYTQQPADAILLKEYEIPIYKAEITQKDTTLEQINAKLGMGMYRTFTVNPIGGRLEISPASTFLDTGTYEFDVRVTNPAGTRDVKSVGIIRLVNPTNPFEITRQVVGSTPANAETPNTNQTNFTLTVTRAAGPNRVILRFLDKNGAAFNPKTQLIHFTDDRPTLRSYAPFYPEVKTDTSLVYQFPEKVPTFPLFTYTSINPSTGAATNRTYTFYYRIPAAANDLNININPEIGFRLWPVPGENSVSGTYTITMKLNFVAKKP